MTQRKPAVVLLSGGIDSATVLALAIERGFDVHALTFRYGQRHEIEVRAAHQLAQHFGVVRHIVTELGLREFGGSALTSELEVPRHGETAPEAIPVTYVPARNTIFLSLALAWAEVLGAQDLFIGANADDTQSYPDCRGEFFRAFERMGDLATRDGVGGKQRLTIHAPLSELSKADTVRLAQRLGVPFGHTWSCYDPAVGGQPCRVCDACVIRSRAFASSELKDPLDSGAAP